MSHAPFESDSPLDDGQFFSDGKKVSCRLGKNLIVISSFVKRKPSDNNEIELQSNIFKIKNDNNFIDVYLLQFQN